MVLLRRAASVWAKATMSALTLLLGAESQMLRVLPRSVPRTQ